LETMDFNNSVIKYWLLEVYIWRKFW
jgi:hypothetical protein